MGTTIMSFGDDRDRNEIEPLPWAHEARVARAARKEMTEDAARAMVEITRSRYQAAVGGARIVAAGQIEQEAVSAVTDVAKHYEKKVLEGGPIVEEFLASMILGSQSRLANAADKAHRSLRF